MPWQNRISHAFDGKGEHIVKVNIPNMAYSGQHIDIEIPHGSRDHVFVPDTVKITFNIDITSTDKTRCVVSNAGRALAKTKERILASKNIDTINNSDIYDTFKELYLGEKECEKNLFQGIQSANSLKARVGAKRADGTALTLTSQANAIKKMMDNWFAISLGFDFFKHPIYPYWLKERLFVRLELNSAGKVLLCTGYTNATYKLSDISLEHDQFLTNHKPRP